MKEGIHSGQVASSPQGMLTLTFRHALEKTPTGPGSDRGPSCYEVSMWPYLNGLHQF